MADIEKQMMRIIKSGGTAKGKSPVANNLSGDVNNSKPFEECMNKPVVDNAECDTDKPDKPKRHGMENLIPMNALTEEKQREIASAGGKASGEARRKKKDLKERCRILLEMVPKQDLITKSLGENAELPEGADMYDLIMAKMMQVASLDGNVKAAEFVRDSAGDKPTDKSEVTASVMTEKDIELMQIIERRMSAGDGQKPE